MSNEISLYTYFEIAYVVGAGGFVGVCTVAYIALILDWAGAQIAQFMRRKYK
jgi:hypothetical protein